MKNTSIFTSSALKMSYVRESIFSGGVLRAPQTKLVGENKIACTSPPTKPRKSFSLALFLFSSAITTNPGPNPSLNHFSLSLSLSLSILRQAAAEGGGGAGGTRRQWCSVVTARGRGWPVAAALVTMDRANLAAKVAR